MRYYLCHVDNVVSNQVGKSFALCLRRVSTLSWTSNCADDGVTLLSVCLSSAHSGIFHSITWLPQRLVNSTKQILENVENKQEFWSFDEKIGLDSGAVIASIGGWATNAFVRIQQYNWNGYVREQMSIRNGVLDDCPRPRGQLEDKIRWPWHWPRPRRYLVLRSNS